jgi:hypothetical protein
MISQVVAFASLSFAIGLTAAASSEARLPTAAEEIRRDGLDKGIHHFVAARLKPRLYFMGKSANDCKSVSPPPAGFEAVPVVDCIYSDSGLDGWVRLAEPSPDLIAGWILKASSLCKRPERCAAKLAADAWASNQYSFPIAGNVIEPASSRGGTGSVGTNFFFINGVTVVRPSFLDGLTANGKNAKGTASLPIEVQKQCLLALLAIAVGDTPMPLPDDAPNSCTKLALGQVSRPAAIRQDIYVLYGDPSKTKAERLMQVGISCPPSVRKVNWLAITEKSFLDGLRTGDHSLFDTAARAIDAGEVYHGRVKCPK